MHSCDVLNLQDIACIAMTRSCDHWCMPVPTAWPGNIATVLQKHQQLLVSGYVEQKPKIESSCWHVISAEQAPSPALPSYIQVFKAVMLYVLDPCIPAQIQAHLLLKAIQNFGGFLCKRSDLGVYSDHTHMLAALTSAWSMVATTFQLKNTVRRGSAIPRYLALSILRTAKI